MIRILNKSNALAIATAVFMVVAWSLPDPAEARRGGGHRGGGGGGGGHRSVKGRTHTKVNRGSRNKSVNRKNVNKRSVNKNVNRKNVNKKNVNVNKKNVNVNNRNRNVNINKNVNVNVDRRGGYYGRRYNPIATAAAVTATAVVVGSIVNSLPSNCTTVVTNNVSYRQCGNSWYEPRYSGGSTSYVVVNSPY
ncbi:MAG: hypothetical protein U9Q75_10685 [Pseudomonadota bacterium]|nr:hypothetical protein [Pseudomonadota bacterium]